ncbi:hypothetical protein BcepIL02_gp26 [Burkholderia phage BcepIL02]|uniref:Uncharacterized protein n=1 Tax=Burkholderia phage BcepIL02 TaxID=2886898 RepID=C5IHL8_9CAUD|nr:hypothetical protein BcepIL02_gp26 [Burkholderia phage BcepIL02]ACR15019.1 hypothetical protein BcepIL02_gp26 [Burkholderia phage BcepIL02]
MSDTQPTEPGTDVALLPPTERALVVLKSTATEEALKALILRTSVIIAPPVDKAGREEVHRAAMDHKNARLAIEKAGKAATEDAKAFSKAVSSEEKRLIALNAEEEARLFKLRDDYDEKVAREKEEADRKERERVAAIREKIAAIKDLPVVSAADNAETLAATLDDLRGFEITFEDFAEFQDEARAARDASITSLTTMHAAANAREVAEAALAAQREEIERQQRELAEQQAEIARQRAELEAQKNAPPEGWMEAGEAYDQQQERLAQRERADALADEPMSEDERQRHIAGHVADAVDDLSDRPEPEVAGMVALDQPRQRAENAAVAYMLDNTPPSPLPESERRRVIVEPEFAGFDMAAGPDVNVEMVSITRDEYDSLLTRSRWLECLEAAGVDNWEGIDEALRINREQVPA